MSTIKKVCLVGVTGTLGPALLSALLAANYEVTVLLRESSSPPSDLPSSVRSIRIPNEFPLDSLTSALESQDAVVASFKFSSLDAHLRLVEAAFRAGVKRFIPADFGSCDATSPNAQKLLKLYRDKDMVREKLDKLATSSAADGGDFTWTSIVPGHFFDWGLATGFLHFDLSTRVAKTLDGGTVKASASTLSRIAEAAVRTLQRPEETKNKIIYVQSFCISPQELLQALERISGQKWTTEDHKSDDYLAENIKKLEEGDIEAQESIVFVLGALEADWTKKENFAMELLGLEDEDLDTVVKRVLEEHQKAA